MKCTITLILLLLASLYSIAQFSDNFEDGDLINGTLWIGDTQKFKVNADHQLQLNTSGEGASYISAELQTSGVVEWNIRIKLSFSPSDNNHTLIYLVSDSPDLMTPLDGYYLKLGETGSSDAIELYRQCQSELFLVARGKDGFLKDPFDVRIKVVRDDGHWQLFADSTAGNDFVLQGAGDDDYWQEYEYFGIVCRYTSSNSTKFRFDDIYAGPLIIDSKPPELLEAIVSGASSIDLYFSEPMQGALCAQLSNYQMDDDIGFPEAAGRDVNDPSIVHLLFFDQFAEGKEYALAIVNLTDEAGNCLQATTTTVVYYPVMPFDILINEIMADPSPSVGLPECEYLELYNTTSHKIRVEDWKLMTGDSEKLLPGFTIEPRSYYLLTGSGYDSLLAHYGPASGMSAFALLNTGATIALKDKSDAMIHHVTYDPLWYKDKLKATGGWSLELIDPLNPCGEEANWSVSIDPSGGSPGRINSVNDSNPDNSIPEIAWLAVPDSVNVKVVFNEVMDSLSMINPFSYLVDHGIGYPLSVRLNSSVYNSLTLSFSSGFLPDTVYCLTINGGMTDCAGNEIKAGSRVLFSLPFDADTNDLVINELLFDPGIAGSEFVEIYNRSSKVISFKGLFISRRDPVTGSQDEAGSISEDDRIMFPGEYLVLTADPYAVKSEYFTPNPKNFITCTDLPSMTNSGGTIAITNRAGAVIDEFTYSEDMHFALLNTTKGVSLERVDFNRSANDRGNWHSAASSAGFATPAYMNSQFMQNTMGEKVITIEPVTISPDNDGFNDQLTISCKFTEPGNLVSIRIYDDEGRFIKLVTGNHLAGDYSVFSWDGTDDEKQKVTTGIYIVFAQILNLNGTVNNYKEAVVVSGY